MSAKPLNIADAITLAVSDVTKHWAKQRKAEDRDHNARLYRYDRLVTRSERVTIKRAAFEVMEAAYMKASDNGQLPTRLPTRPRQIMYVARPEILKRTGERMLNDTYFTQDLLPNYIAEYSGECDGWDIVWDARGRFTEPHTKHEVALGTLEVREYLGMRAQRTDVVAIDQTKLFATCGPEQRFSAVLFIEKEGFGPLFAATQLAERYDLAIMSTKGMSVTAARMLLDQLVGRGIEKVFALHDFDVSGFTIFGTLGKTGRRYRFTNQVPIIDIGLRLEDVEDMGLESEPVNISNDWDKVSETLEGYGASEEEIEFLKDKRVELNAMTSRQFIDFVENKLKEHGVEKLLPDDDIIEEHARRLLEQRFAGEAIAPLRDEIAERAQQAELPDDLRHRVADLLEAEPHLPWDIALAQVLDGDHASTIPIKPRWTNRRPRR